MSTRLPQEVEEEDFGPAMSGRGGRRLRGRASSVPKMLLGVVLILVLFVLAVALYANAQINRIRVGGLAEPSRPLHVLVTGSDSRAGLSAEDRRELTTGGAEGERTDTIFIMTIADGKAALLAFPRDLYVTRCDGSEGRINAATGIQGPGCLVRTVRALSGIPVSQYMQIDFLGFRDLVDAAGGVDVCLDAPIADVDAGIDLPAGCQTLGGADALGYVRVRKIDDDLQRIQRQQQFVKALAKKIAAPSTFLNPLRLFSTAGAGGSALTANEGLGLLDLARIAWGVRGIASAGPTAYTVPATPASVGGASVLVPVEDEAAQLFRRFRSGAVLDEVGAAAAPAPEEIDVAVRNAAGVDGLATTTAATFEEAGFTVVEVGNAGQRADTVILYPPGQEATAQVVASELTVDATLEESAEAAVPTVVLGSDAAG